MKKENMLEYKGYYAEIEYSAADKVLFGSISGIADLISFESNNTDEIETAFQEAVDDYLEMCERIGKEPNKPYRGSFNVRITPELHKKAVRKANVQGISLNEFVSRAIENSLSEKKEFSTSVINIDMKYFSSEKKADFGKGSEIAQRLKNIFDSNIKERGVYNAKLQRQF